jgi:hypothetical protein
MITLSGTSAYLFAPPGCSLRESSAVQVTVAPIGGPVTHTRQLLPAGPHLLPRKPSETGTGQLGTRLAASNQHRSVDWLTRTGAIHVLRAGLHHRALPPRVRGHGSRSGDAVAATRVREPLACTTTATADPSTQRDGRAAFNEGDSSAAGGLRGCWCAGQREGGMRGGVETLMLVLIATVLFMWVVLGHSTSDERARLHDSMGDSTGIAWR